ncbi:MAG: phosphoribosylformylglycinamidine synthase subunit PurQ [Candidatus Woesearchaeota archaeon]
MALPKALITAGNGRNCEAETRYAFHLGGSDPEIIYIYDILENPKIMQDYHMLALIGGFHDGDHLGAGKTEALLYKHKLWEPFMRFIESGKPVICICNGFQAAVKMGILPAFNGEYGVQTATLMNNDSGIFEDRWVHLNFNKNSKCIWTKGLESIFVPVRHGEGKYYAEQPLVKKLFDKNQVVAQYVDETGRPTMEYPKNPNGSLEAIAGICDEKGTIFGLMPHPEAFLSPYNHPSWTRDVALGKKLPKEGPGVQVFRNAVQYVNESLMP